ncbi:hypothetical protein TNCV_761981 [Trichonephila clavipes]|nr:hypothetical protein TNCV_761981 [Trichonephila clavipes]
MYPIKTLIPLISPLFARLIYVEIVVPATTQADYSRWRLVPTLHRRDFRDRRFSPASTRAESICQTVRCEATPLRRLLHCYLVPTLRRRNEAKIQPLHRLNEVSRKWRRSLHGRCCSLSRLWFKIEILSIAAEPP